MAEKQHVVVRKCMSVSEFTATWQGTKFAEVVTTQGHVKTLAMKKLPQFFDLKGTKIPEAQIKEVRVYY